MQSQNRPAAAVVVLAVFLTVAVLGLLVFVGGRGDGCGWLCVFAFCSFLQYTSSGPKKKSMLGKAEYPASTILSVSSAAQVS